MNEALEALRELVAIRAIRDEAEALLFYDTDTEGRRNLYRSLNPRDMPRYNELMDAYHKRRDAAWAKAKAIVQAADT